MQNKGLGGLGKILGILVVLIAFVGGIMFIGGFLPTFGKEGKDVYISDVQGEDATVYFSAFTGKWGEAGSKSEVYPTWTLIDSEGTTIINDATANSTSQMSVGDAGDLYCTGASYYCDKTHFEVKKKKETLPDIPAYKIPTTANMEIKVYDDTGSTELTADDNSNNTADYAGTNLGAGQTYSYYIRFKNAVADRTFRLGAILTYYCGDEVDDFTLEESGWTEVSVPSGDLDTSFTHYDDTNSSTTCTIKHAYVPTSGYIALNEWDSVKYQFVIDTDDSSAPTANGDSYVGAIFVDYACNPDESGNLVCSWYNHDNNADPDDIGLNEAVVSSGYKGLDVGVCIEPQ